MPVQIYRRQSRSNSIGDAILSGVEGWMQGDEFARQRRKDALAAAYTQALTSAVQDRYTPKPWKTDPRLAAMAESGFTASGEPLDPNYRQALKNQLYPQSDSEGGNAPVMPSAGLPRRTLPLMPGASRDQLSPRDHYNQLRASGYSPADARRMAGI